MAIEKIGDSINIRLKALDGNASSVFIDLED
jgi:hypothetical protein